MSPDRRRQLLTSQRTSAAGIKILIQLSQSKVLCSLQRRSADQRRNRPCEWERENFRVCRTCCGDPVGGGDVEGEVEERSGVGG